MSKIKINGYNYVFMQTINIVAISAFHVLYYDLNIMNFFNTSLIFTPEVFILYEKVWCPREWGPVNFDIP